MCKSAKSWGITMKWLLISETYPYNLCSWAMLGTYVAVGICLRVPREAVHGLYWNSRDQEINALILNHSLTHLISVRRGTQTQVGDPHREHLSPLATSCPGQTRDRAGQIQADTPSVCLSQPVCLYVIPILAIQYIKLNVVACPFSTALSLPCFFWKKWLYDHVFELQFLNEQYFGHYSYWRFSACSIKRN